MLDLWLSRLCSSSEPSSGYSPSLIALLLAIWTLPLVCFVFDFPFSSLPSLPRLTPCLSSCLCCSPAWCYWLGLHCLGEQSQAGKKKIIPQKPFLGWNVVKSRAAWEGVYLLTQKTKQNRTKPKQLGEKLEALRGWGMQMKR